MAWSTGALIGQAMAGAVAGGAQAELDQLNEDQKNQRMMMRDQYLSGLRTDEAQKQIQMKLAALPQQLATETAAKVNEQGALLPGQIAAGQAQSDIRLAEERAKPRVLSPGSTEVVPQSPVTEPIKGEGEDGSTIEGTMSTPQPDKTFTAPTRLSPGQENYYNAHADEAKTRAARMQAEADAINRDVRYNAQRDRPNVIIDKENGRLIDKNTGAIGITVEGAPGKPAVSHFFKPDEPATPKQPNRTVWFDNSGNPLRNGLDDLYPKRAAGGKSDAAPDVQNDIESAARSRAPDAAAPTPGPTATSAAPGKFATPDDVRAAYQAGRLTRDQAKQELSRFGFQ